MSNNVKVKAPKDCGSFSHDGKEYSFNKKGVATVPAEALPALASHGIVPLDADVKEDEESEQQEQSPEGEQK